MLGFCCSFALAGPRDPSPVPPDYRFNQITWSSLRNVPIPLPGLGKGRAAHGIPRQGAEVFGVRR